MIPRHRIILMGIAILSGLVAAVLAMEGGSLMPLALMALVPCGLMILPHPDLLVMIGWSLSFSFISIPGFPPSMDLSRVLLFFALPPLFIRVLLGGKTGVTGRGLRAVVWGYAVVLAVHMAVRGFGLRLMSGEVWGSGEAIAQFIYILLFLLRDRMAAPRRHWLPAFTAMTALSVLPMAADLLLLVTGGAAMGLFYFIAPAANVPSPGRLGGAAVWRLQRAIFFIPGLAQWSLAMFRMRRLKLPAFGVALLGCLALLGISGHRIMLLQLTLFAAVCFFLSKRGRVLRMGGSFALATLLAWAALIPVSRHLPLAAQRVISFVPGIHLAEVARRDAEGTVRWRVALWKENMRDVPKYFWVGKGLVIHPSELMSYYNRLAYARYAGERIDTIEEMTLLRDYHNGPLALLLDLGVFGLLTGGAITVLLCRETLWNTRLRVWRHNDLRQIHFVLGCGLLAEVATFWLLYGDVRAMMRFMFLGTLLAAIRRSDDMEPAPAADAAQEAPE